MTDAERFRALCDTDSQLVAWDATDAARRAPRPPALAGGDERVRRTNAGSGRVRDALSQCPGDASTISRRDASARLDCFAHGVRTDKGGTS
jgi:hypothetical protein